MKINKNKKIISMIIALALIIPFLTDGLGVFANSITDLFSINNTLTNNEIRILEIQPTDNFALGDSKVKTGEVKKTIDNQTVIVEHITMAEFIGRVDKINGKYDVIVIGRKKNLLGSNYTFKDYTSLDNDITNRKADEIIDFLKTGQLVYVDTSIKSSGNDSLDKNTKLYKKLGKDQNSEIKEYENNNLIRKDVESSNDVTVEKIVEKYNKITNKKVILEVTEYPQGDNVNRQLKYKLNIKSKTNSNGKVGVKLYLDINGDGLYKEKEIYGDIKNLSSSSSDIEINYTLDKQFLGYLGWKLEVTDSNNVKSYITSSFEVKGESRTIRVLQVMDGANNTSTSSTGKDGLLNLSTNTKFQELIEKTREDYGYNIVIDSIGSDNFYQGNDYIDVNGRQKQLNGDYDMLIIGFRDYFDTSKITDKAIEEIKKFANTGQGIMLTHDTTYYDGGDLSTNTSNNRHRVTKALADYIGQSRYENDFNITGNDFTGKIITHDTDKPNTGKIENLTDEEIKENMGATIWKRKNKITTDALSSTVYKTNNSLITSYPYEIDTTISVRKTHGQYLQLNLEDEDVVPWINLSGGYINQYDSRNSYYTYSKGNITFSGTGENKRDNNEFPDIEFKLFINTIIKAERGSNHAPEIESSINDNEEVEIPVNEKYTFTTTARDLDNDKINVTVKINGTVVENINGKSISSGELIDIDLNPTDLNTITVEVEAVDENGAKAETKTYILKPTKEAQVQASNVTVNGLIGDELEATIDLTKLYDNSNNIKTVSIDKIDYDTSGMEIRTENSTVTFSNNNAKVKLYITLKEQYTSRMVKVNFKYSINGHKRIVTSTIYVNSKEGVIKIEVVDSQGNVLKYSDIKSVVEENSNENILTKLFNRSASLEGVEAYIRINNQTINHTKLNESTGKAEFRMLTTNNYEVDISDIPGYDVICDNKNVNLNYENSEQTRIFTVSISSRNKVTMKVTDSSGTIDKAYDSSKNSNDYNIKYDYDNFNDIYKLYGKSNVEIDFEGELFNYLEYRFVNEDDGTTTDWIGIDAEGDVVDEPGYLTQMPYDVSSLPTLSGHEIWSNRDTVFNTNNAFESDTEKISMEVFKFSWWPRNEYVTKIENNGEFVRWQPKTYFVEDHYVEAYANNYKEARKTWGYIKVPESGNYSFQTISDDGIYAILTVNDEIKVIADAFRPKSSWEDIQETENIYLEKDKYYPIYIEYFNFGGSAALEIKYKKEGEWTYNNIPADCFYPSNSKNPIQGGNNIFTGAQNINFPEATGTYIIEYRVGTKYANTDEFNILKTGSFGKFAIDDRFNLEKSSSDEQVSVGDTFNITYKLEPKDITLRELYKLSGNELKNKTVPDTLTIKNITINDILPDGLQYINNNENLGGIFNIEYKLNKIGEKSEWKYEAQTVTVDVAVKANKIQSIEFEDNSGYITYGDVTLDEQTGYLWKKTYFNRANINVVDSSKIIAHGKYENNSTIGSSQVSIIPNMYYSFAVNIDIKNIDNTLKIDLDNNIIVDSKNVFVYNCNDNGKIQDINNSVEVKSGSGYIEISNFAKGKYFVVYSLKSTSNSNIKANLLNSSGNTIDSKNVNLTIQSGELPELF